MFTDLLECNIKGIHLPMRWIVCLIMCGGVMICDTERRLLGLIMTIIFGNPVLNTTLCPIDDGDGLSPPKINVTLKLFKDFTFSRSRPKWIHQSFYISYLIFHIPCGIIIDRIGPRALVGLGVAMSTVATILTPIYYWSTTASIVVSVIMGAGQASLYPGINAFCVNWAPYFQRGVILGLIFSSYGLIRAINFATASKILDGINSWHAGFYIWGMIGLMWYVIFLMYSYSDPLQHPFVPKPERIYLKLKAVQPKHGLKTPWAAIIRDKAVWAIISAELAFSISSYTWRTEAKKYFWMSFAYDIEHSTFFYVLPNVLMVFLSMIAGIINDYLLTSRKLSTRSIRKIFSTIGICLPAILMVAFGHAGCHKHLAQWLFFVILVLECAVCGGGHLQSVLDVSVNFPGVVTAIVKAFGMSSSLAVPHLLDFFEETQMKKTWKLSFYFSFILTIILSIFFAINVPDTRAQWDFTSEDEMETWPNRLLEMKSENGKREKKRRSEDDDDLSD